MCEKTRREYSCKKVRLQKCIARSMATDPMFIFSPVSVSHFPTPSSLWAWRTSSTGALGRPQGWWSSLPVLPPTGLVMSWHSYSQGGPRPTSNFKTTLTFLVSRFFLRPFLQILPTMGCEPEPEHRFRLRIFYTSRYFTWSRGWRRKRRRLLRIRQRCLGRSNLSRPKPTFLPLETICGVIAYVHFLTKKTDLRT